MRFLKRLVLVCIFVGVLSLKPVTDRMPEPMKAAFTNIRETALVVASGDGISFPDIRNMRGVWKPGTAGGVEHVGGR